VPLMGEFRFEPIKVNASAVRMALAEEGWLAE
jgi:hypothetical protein